MIGTVVTDLIENTRVNLEVAKPQSIDDVRQAGRALRHRPSWNCSRRTFKAGECCAPAS